MKRSRNSPVVMPGLTRYRENARHIFWFCYLMLLAGCAGSEERPTGLLSREQFKSTLLGSQLIEARLNHEMVNDKRLDMPVQEYYAELFKTEGVTEPAFKTTFQWYVEHPADMKVIYEEILVELQKRADKPVTAAGH